MSTIPLTTLLQTKPQPPKPTERIDAVERVPARTGGTRPLGELLEKMTRDATRLEPSHDVGRTVDPLGDSAVATDTMQSEPAPPSAAPTDFQVHDEDEASFVPPRQGSPAASESPVELSDEDYELDDSFDPGVVYPEGCGVRRVVREDPPELPMDPAVPLTRSGVAVATLTLLLLGFFVAAATTSAAPRATPRPPPQTSIEVPPVASVPAAPPPLVVAVSPVVASPPAPSHRLPSRGRLEAARGRSTAAPGASRSATRGARSPGASRPPPRATTTAPSGRCVER